MSSTPYSGSVSEILRSFKPSCGTTCRPGRDKGGGDTIIGGRTGSKHQQGRWAGVHGDITWGRREGDHLVEKFLGHHGGHEVDLHIGGRVGGLGGAPHILGMHALV
jgi:hypothetical protein